MLTSFWRTSHFLLAVLTSIFLLIASVSGIILSTQPVVEHFNSPSDKATVDTMRLSQLVPLLQDEYLEVFSISVDKEQAVTVDVIGLDENADGKFYISPSSGQKVGEIPLKSEFYSWVTTLHRSLFMHATGRILMGITVFLLFLMAVSGIALLIKQNRGILNFFNRIKRQNRAQYYHTVLGRLSFIPIVIMALSGAFLFLNTQFKPQENAIINCKLSKNDNIEVSEFPLFQSTLLTEVVTLNFPFSNDEDDYYELELHDRIVKIHQYTGEVVTEKNSTWVQNLSNLSMTLHTGRGQWIWSIVLGLISLNLLYFMYSGFQIAWKRLSSITRNKVRPDEAEYVLLVGSENGTTRRFAQLLNTALLKSGKVVFISEMNHYQKYPKAKQLIILTSTYGDGQAPFNARYFLSKVNEISQGKAINTHVIGFGSMVYPKFCQFAIDVYDALEVHKDFQLALPPKLIDGNSYTSFKLSVEEWRKHHSIQLELPQEDQNRTASLIPFKVLDKQMVDDGYCLTFTLELQAQGKVNFQSGDLLEIIPPGENLVRYYSICKNQNGNILLSVKKHKFGMCSSYLFEQEIDTCVSASVKVNSKFHFPKKGAVLMIANGTGIAPFLGMKSLETKQKKVFFLGGRNPLSFNLYAAILQTNATEKENNEFHFAMSKMNENKNYVQNLVLDRREEVLRLLNNKGSIMICGSVRMRDGVLDVLKKILIEEGGTTLEKYIEKKKILIDCY